jgi:catechol 2,3-dioxygenase-like lactoylglutathione lyase family enzyme
MKPIELTFNFVGVSAAAWEPAFRFFNEILGIQAERRAEFGDWAVLGGGWDAYHNKDNRSAVFELFDNGRAVTARRWGLEQGIRPAFHVPNLPHAVEDLRARGITQIGDITERPWSKVVEFTATEGIRFAITEIPGLPSSDNLAAPYIGHVAIKTVDLTVARSFYGDTIGYTQVDAGADYAIYAQQNEHPLIILERGGEASAFDPRNSR